MRVLSIDTSTHIGSVALRGEKDILGLITLSVSLTHSEGLMPAIDALLQQTQTAPADLTAVACVTGPGSYTGLRIGIATAQGLAAAHDLSCVGIPSLAVYAHAFPHAKYTLCPLLPARKGWVYARVYAWEVDKPVPRSEELNLQPDELIKQIHEPTLFYGPGLDAVKEELKTILRDDFIDAKPVHNLPRADLLAELAAAELARGNTLDPAQLQPHYLGPSQAEINWKQRNPQP